MKKVINGKVYDTTTAQAVGAWDNGIYGDLTSVSVTLYRKRTGEFFLHGEGGARTQYAVQTGDNSWAPGAKIIPLSWEAAREWAEKNMTAEEYEAAFGPVVEDDSKTVVTLSLSVSAVERAKRAAAQAGVGLSAYIESLIG